MERNSFKDTYKRYRVNKTLAQIAAVGTVGGVATLSLNFAILALYFTFMFLRVSQKSYEEIVETDEYIRFNEIYNFVFEELIKNIDTFGIKTIEEIFSYFTVIMSNGYLNYDRYMKPLYDQNLIGELSISEALSLNEHGLCRNVTPMLTRIIEHYGFEAVNLGCDQRYGKKGDYVLDKSIDITNMSRKEILFAVGKEKLESSIKAYKERYPNKPQFKNNHMITQANDKDYTYYLDASLLQVYVPIPGRSEEYVSYKGNFIILQDQMQEEKIKSKAITQKRLEEKAFKDIFEMLYNLDQTEEMLLNNEDIIEEMYTHTQPALEEAEAIYQKILLPKKFKLF